VCTSQAPILFSLFFSPSSQLSHAPLKPFPSLAPLHHPRGRPGQPAARPRLSTTRPHAAAADDADEDTPLIPTTPSSPPAPVKPSQQPWPGAKPIPLALSVGAGLALRFLVPVPAGLTPSAWSLLSIFVATIAGLVLEPLPTGAWAFLAATAAIGSGALTFAQAFSAFANDVIWLIVVSFFFAAGFQKTGLGARVANLFVRAFGSSTLGLAYGLTVAEAVLAPAMPSTTARAGGIFMPIIDSLARDAGSEPGTPSASKLGSFLVQCQLQASVNSSALFLTAAAQNLLCLKLAAELGVVLPGGPWLTGASAAAVPAALGLALTPLIVFRLNPPSITATPDAPRAAAERLRKMGPLSRDEAVMAATMGLAVVLWVAGDALGVPAVLAAMLGLCVLLLSGVLTWRDCLTYTAAWDTLFWFAVLVGMSGQLNAAGVVSHFASAVGGALAQLSLAWPAALALLAGAYWGLHYLFASQTAHVGALYSAFLAMLLAAGAPGPLAALVLAFVSNLFGSMTHYGSGQAAVYYGAGYLSLSDIFRAGAVMAGINALIWGVVGGGWWVLTGLAG
jgi:divalent anion:Na+ symporter, DASS family